MKIASSVAYNNTFSPIVTYNIPIKSISDEPNKNN